MRRRLADLSRLAAGGPPWLLASIVLVSVVVRLTTRDALPGVATLFYATPPVVNAALLAVAGTWWIGLRCWRPAAVLCLAALVLVAWQGQLSWFRHEPSPGQLRVLFWNVKGGERGWDRVAREISAREPDLVLLVEANRGAERLLPGYRWRRPGRTLAIGVHGTVGDTEVVPLGRGGRAAIARVTVRDRPLTVMVVDIVSNPFQHRREAFARLAELRARVAPDVVAGDFNTPRDSVFFDPWRSELRHAFEAAGRGADWTWPMPFPVLAIDHVWTARTLVPRASRHEGTPASDHRVVVVDLAWAN